MEDVLIGIGFLLFFSLIIIYLIFQLNILYKNSGKKNKIIYFLNKISLSLLIFCFWKDLSFKNLFFKSYLIILVIYIVIISIINRDKNIKNKLIVLYLLGDIIVFLSLFFCLGLTIGKYLRA